MESHEEIAVSQKEYPVPPHITARIQQYLNTYHLQTAEHALVTKQVLERVSARITMNPQQGLSLRLAIEEAQFAMDEWFMLSNYRPSTETPISTEITQTHQHDTLLRVYTEWLVRTNLQIHRGQAGKPIESPLRAVPAVLENKVEIRPFEFWSLWGWGKQLIVNIFFFTKSFFSQKQS
ncbi:hypothetical protein [Beggiatoa leptomitoformis]|uniref:Uncharacterized protein n=1 Tax=Beggiatoa leptomitoformis TaxID=288004 RepID=A0A2N9YGB1_9GAMM|nr:hypothetical protein [Beggiatoa leptomitoformis]ALG68162.1 hypothetical protein AL038_11135 [Beggiatoa leptomitoformis]AUI69540.1 hypothetical protein BLE401_13125 [Beggiatoa leptomitoformis]